MEAKLQNIKQKLHSRMHQPVPKVGEWLERVLNGHYQYFGVPGNWASLGLFRERIGPLLGPGVRPALTNWESLCHPAGSSFQTLATSSQGGASLPGAALCR